VPNGCGSHADASSVRRDTYWVGNETETAGNEAEHVRTRRNKSRMQNSPDGCEIATRLTKSGNNAEVNKTFASQVSNSFESDTFYWEQHSAKYIYWITLLYLSFHHTTLFMGECWSYKQIVVVYLLTYISIMRTYSRVYYHSPSVACQHTEGEYISTNHFPTY